jgi:hypothetical protein
VSPAPFRTAPGAARRGLFCVGGGPGGRRAARPLLLGGLALALLLAFGCGGKNTKPTVADTQVEDVSKLVAAMAQGLKTRDVDALVALWDPARRADVAGRIRKALKQPGAIDLNLSLIGLRLEPGHRQARVAWQGTWGGEAVSGGFDMELTDSNPPRILAMRGEDPAGAGTPDTGTTPPVRP